MPAGRIVLSAEQHEPAVLPTTDLAEVNCLGEQTQLGEQLPDIPDKGHPRRWSRCPRLRGADASRSSNPAGQVYASWATPELLAGSPTGFTDRGLRELKGTVGRAPRLPGRAVRLSDRLNRGVASPRSFRKVTRGDEAPRQLAADGLITNGELQPRARTSVPNGHPR